MAAVARRAKLVVVASLMLCLSCASRMQGACEAKEWLGTILVAKRAAIDEVRAKYLSIAHCQRFPKRPSRAF
jgi:disulfide oxidoreductase YuzD